ncbi:MAG: HTH-type transcriptional activator IlvY [Deltaproteobacteria bacterium]|nr:HTH-type transcriptional activator IlvY [Deltaproteobacteria bacterium]
MDYDALSQFSHLCRTLHFGRTSRELHVSPSALSRTISRLEEELGWPLFERDRRTVRLTPEGQQFQVHAVETLQRWQAFSTRLSRKSEALSGEIGIFASVTACQSFLPRILTAFRSLHPEIRIKLETGYAADALGMLAAGAVDVAVAALPEKVATSLVSRIVVVTPLEFVAPVLDCETTRLLERTPVPWDAVPMVLPAGGIARVSVDRWFRQMRIRPNVYGEVSGNEASLSLVSLGCGVGIVPRIVVDRSPLRNDIRVLSVAPHLPPFRVGVCTQKRKLTHPIVRAFWDSIS